MLERSTIMIEKYDQPMRVGRKGKLTPAHLIHCESHDIVGVALAGVWFGLAASIRTFRMDWSLIELFFSIRTSICDVNPRG